MVTSLGGNGCGSVTVKEALTTAPLIAVALISTVPGSSPRAAPAATLAIAGSLLSQVKGAPGTGLSSASNATAVNDCVVPARIVALAGAMLTRAIGVVGAGTSLHAPNVLGVGALQTSAAFRCRDFTASAGDAGSVVVDPDSLEPMSVEVMPTAGPFAAVKVPSYERNSTTTPAASTRATPSGEPFWSPETVATTTPRGEHFAGMRPPRSTMGGYVVPPLPLYGTTFQPVRS